MSWLIFKIIFRWFPQSDNYVLSFWSHWLTASWASLLCRSELKPGFDTKRMSKDECRSQLFFHFILLGVKTTFIFQEQQNGSVSFMRVQIIKLHWLWLRMRFKKKTHLSKNLILCYCLFHKSLLSHVLRRVPEGERDYILHTKMTENALNF